MAVRKRQYSCHIYQRVVLPDGDVAWKIAEDYDDSAAVNGRQRCIELATLNPGVTYRPGKWWPSVVAEEVRQFVVRDPETNEIVTGRGPTSDDGDDGEGDGDDEPVVKPVKAPRVPKADPAPVVAPAPVAVPVATPVVVPAPVVVPVATPAPAPAPVVAPAPKAVPTQKVEPPKAEEGSAFDALFDATPEAEDEDIAPAGFANEPEETDSDEPPALF